MPTFTTKQGRYLSFIYAYIEGFGLSPAETEIAEAMGVQPPSVNGMMKTLEKKQLIRRKPGVARSIEILIDPATLPMWKKKISRTVYQLQPTKNSPQWVKDTFLKQRAAAKRPHSTSARSPAKSNGKAYRFKISLRDFKPTIWRRIEIGNLTLERFNELIQCSMGWTNSHLHEFDIGKERFTHPKFMDDSFEDFGATDYSGITISDLVEKYGEQLKFRFLYDFGDCWEHDVVLEKIIDVEPNAIYDHCVDGQRACPPEDVGGVGGYAEFIEAISDPTHEQHEDMLQWSGPFDPDEFDPEQATNMMAEGFPVWY